ncbi:MAG: hypothetical protein OXI90_17075 [Gammaproteobacteria bacterium]|nr:hypothetical protein [Gammaproteobacteria bacterium]
MQRSALYRKLLRLAANTLGYVEAALPTVAAESAPWARAWTEKAYSDLLLRIADQAKRRVLRGEAMPAEKEVTSLFEPYTDIIRKGGRVTRYGHKVNLATGRSGLVLDAAVEDGSPAASERCLPMLERTSRITAQRQRAPRSTAATSRNNLDAAKALGVQCVVFHKRARLRDAAMAPSAWLLDQLRRFCRHRGGRLPSEALLRPGVLPMARHGRCSVTMSGGRTRLRRRP